EFSPALGGETRLAADRTTPQARRPAGARTCAKYARRYPFAAIGRLPIWVPAARLGDGHIATNRRPTRTAPAHLWPAGSSRPHLAGPGSKVTTGWNKQDGWLSG